MNPFFRILRYILRYKVYVGLGIFCSLMYASTNGLSAYLVGPFVKTIFTGVESMKVESIELTGTTGIFKDVKNALQVQVNGLIGKGDRYEVLTRLCVLIIIVILIKNVFSYFQGYIMAYVEQGVVRNLREDVYTSYHRLPLRYFQKRKTGDLISRVINDCNTINTNLNSALISLMLEPINIIVLLGLMIIINWKLTLLFFLIAPPSLYIIGKINNKLRRRTVRTQDRIAAITSVLGETISNIRIVKAFAMEQFEIDKFKSANGSYFRAMLRLFRFRRMAPPVTEVLGVSMAVIVLWIGGSMVLQQKGLNAEDFIMFILWLFLLMQSAKNLSEVNVKMQVGIAATDRVFEIIDRPSEIKEHHHPRSINTLQDGIRFRNVWYEYEKGKPVLSDINLDVKVGENIAIVGPSGGGKSTLMDILPRFFDPVSGTVEIDGNDIRRYKLDDLRRLFGIVTQETILFHDTIKANIAYGRPDIPFDKIVSATKTAYAHDFIMKFEKGYDTVIGDRGTKLSGGQKQRLVIARAILKNPPILIFDEATSSLDSESEAEVQGAIDKLMEGRTSFVIAHRLSTIQKATTILVIDKGRIVETGTHEELYNKNGIYRRLYDLQFLNTRTEIYQKS